MHENGHAIRKLIVVSTQDASKISSWSNVPYLFCETLKAQDVQLVPVTLRENALLRWLTFAARKGVSFLTGRSTSWDYSRSRLHAWHARRQINRVCCSHDHDAVLVLSFSHAPSTPKRKPLFIFGDWPYAYAIEMQLGRKADCLERGAIERELRLIGQADAVFVLFPLAREYLAGYCPIAKTYYLGNVINAVEVPQEADLDAKCDSSSLLFIGKPHYFEGARRLLLAFERLKPRIPSLSLDIIGMDRALFPSMPEGVTCHGYLDKGNDEERQTYYKLLRQARLFINTNPKWASFSATLEALYFYIPIISSHYPEMVKTFGEKLLFGYYFEEGGSKPLEDLIADLLDDPEYREKAIFAHEATLDLSWHNYVRRVLEIANAALTTRNQQLQ